MKAFTSFDQLLEVAREEKPKDIFSATVSNPPYQMLVGGDNTRSLPIWHEFWEVSKSISSMISIISPARWRISRNNIEGEIKENLSKDESKISLIKIYDPSEQIFPNTLIRDGVNIILWNENNQNSLPMISINGVLLDNKRISDSFYPEEANSIFNRINTSSVKMLTHKFYMSSREALRVAQKNYSSEETEVNSVKTLSVFGGLGTRQSFKWISKDPFLKNSDEFFSSYKVARIGFAHDFGERSFILGPSEGLGVNAIFSLFSTRQQAENFKSYLKTSFSIALLKATISDRGGSSTDLLPDITTLVNPRTGLIGYESDWTDEDLKKLFEDVLTPEDWEYIEKVAIESDPVGAKR